MYQEITIQIGIGQSEQKLCIDDLTPGFFAYLTSHTLLSRLIHITKATRKVQCTLGWLFGTSTYEQLITFIDDNSYGRGAGVKVIHKTALQTVIRLLIVLFELSATLGTEMKGLKWV